MPPKGYPESLDHETHEFGIRVSVVEPGYTDTAFDANAADPDSPIESDAVLRGHVKEGLIEAVRAGDDPSVVAKVVLKAATSRTPKLRYPAGSLARQLTLLKRFAPAAVLEKGIRKANKLTAPKPDRVPQNVW
jgi:NAD(P)-dependent dehydrogenase (short-subunit alcohol dehydrogenase family)